MKCFRCTYLIFLIFLSTMLFAQTNADKNKSAIFSFGVGINGNLLLNDKNFYDDFSGIGLFIEPRISENFSIEISLNSMNVKDRKINNLEFRSDDFGNTNLNLLFKWRWYINNKFTFFPEIGFGNWSKKTVLGIIGVGVEHNIHDKIFGSFNIYSINYCQKCLDVGGGGGSGNHFRLTLGFSYLIEKKVKPVR